MAILKEEGFSRRGGGADCSPPPRFKFITLHQQRRGVPAVLADSDCVRLQPEF